MLRKEKNRTGVTGSAKQDLSYDDTGPLHHPDVQSLSGSVPVGDRKWTVTQQLDTQVEQEKRNKTKIC